MRVVLAAAALLLLAIPAQGQETHFRMLDLGLRSLDLQFRVLDLDLPELAVSGEATELAMRETATEIRVELSADVLFDFDKSDIKPEAAQALKQLAAVLRQHSGQPVRIEGHTDAKGSDAYNRALSEDRALSVREWLEDREGLKLAKAEVVGLGESRPVAPNENPDGTDSPDGRQKNRRVEIIIGK